MAYRKPSWMPTGAKRDLLDDGLDDEDGRILKDRMTWCTFLAYIERSSLEVRRMRNSYFGDELGRGRFFEVYRYKIQAGLRLPFTTQKSELLDAGTVVALKRVIPRARTDGEDSLDDSRQLKAIATEIQALSKPSLREHENIIEMYGLVWEDRGEDSPIWPTVVLEYCPCTLQELQSERREPLAPQLKFQITQGVSFGIGALHQENIIHGDVKSENVLIKIQGDGMIIPKLADFGSSVVHLNTNLVEIGGTYPWQAPECVTLRGMIPVENAPGTDYYSLGLLIWRVFRDGQNPFDFLYDIDYECRKKEDLIGNPSSVSTTKTSPLSEARRKLEEEEYIKQKIQRLKESNALIEIAVEDMKKRHPSNPNASVAFNFLFSTYLQSDPEARFEALQSMAEDLGLAPETNSIEEAEENDLHPSAAKNFDWNQIPTTMFSIRNVIRREILDPDFRMGESSRRRIFQELLQLAEKWDNQKNAECAECCNKSPFDESSTENALSMENYLDYLINDFCGSRIHSCVRENIALSYEVATGDWSKQQYEIFGVVFNLFVCYIEGFGVKANIDEGLDWLLKAARWGSFVAQYEVASCFLHFRRPIPPGSPIIKWLMSSVVLFNPVTARTMLGSLNHKFLEIARRTRSVMFNGNNVNIDNWTFDPEHEFRVSVLSKEDDSSIGSEVFHQLASSWRQPVDLCRQVCEKCPELLDAPNARGETPLLLACRSSRYLMIKMLLSLGADASRSAGRNGETPLHWLAIADDDGDFDAVEDVLAHGGDLNAQNREIRLYTWQPSRVPHLAGRESQYVGTALHWAVIAGNYQMVKFLVGKGALVDIKSYIGESPISIAVSKRRSDLLEVLIQGFKGDEIDPADGGLLTGLIYDSTRIARAMHGFGDADEKRTLEVLLKYRPPYRNEAAAENYFRWAVFRGVCAASHELLSGLLDGLDQSYIILNHDNAAAFTGLPLVRDYWGRMDLIHAAVKRNDPQVLDLVLQRGADIQERDSVDYTCLHTLAVSKGNEECLRALLRHGAQVNWLTNTGWLPFHFAIFAGNIEIAQALKNVMPQELLKDALGIITNERSSKFPLTFLGHAITLRSLSFTSVRGVEWLLDLPENATHFKSVCPDGGFSPIHLAVDGLDLAYGVFKEYGKLPVLRLLLSKFAKPELLKLKSKETSTALHLAVWLGKFDETRLLVEHGADIDAISSDGTPLDVAFINPPSHFDNLELGPTREMIRRFMEGRNAIAKYLRHKGAQCAAELQVPIKLGNYIPYAIESGEHVEYFQYSTFLRMRWGHRRYGCATLRPKLRPEQFMKDNLSAKDMVILSNIEASMDRITSRGQ